jgi:hypothetical protein
MIGKMSSVTLEAPNRLLRSVLRAMQEGGNMIERCHMQPSKRDIR